MTETCAGSMGAPGEPPKVSTFLPTAKCSECGRFVEIHPMEPGGADVWRLEMHDTAGRTVRIGEVTNPAADCVMPDTCERCGSDSLSVGPDGKHVEATCSACGHCWRTGHVNPE